MKYVVLCIDGAADWPVSELDNKTPLEAAAMPHLQQAALQGTVGRTQHAPSDMDNGSDICCMSLLGFDPHRYHTGRAPLEAKSAGIELNADQIAVRCNTVTVEDGLMIDYSAGHITTEESRQLIETLDRILGTDGGRFYPGVQYRHILVLDKPPHKPNLELNWTAPHNITGKPVADYLPTGPDAARLLELMERSKSIFAEHPVNLNRRKNHDNPATQIWLWGHGPSPSLPTFKEVYGLEGALISAVDLLKSLGLFLKLDVLKVPGITGFIDTDYNAKATYALNALHEKDFVFIHVEAPDECGHMGDWKLKKESLENIDRAIVGPILQSEFARSERLRLLVCPDHSTPVALKAHATEPIPFLAWGPGFDPKQLHYHETAARNATVFVEHGYELMGRFFKAVL